MEAWAEISIEALGYLIWILAIVVGLAIFRWRLRNLHWAPLGAAVTFIAANVAFGVYVVTHPKDPRWTHDPSLSVPPLADTPMVGQYLQRLDPVMDTVVEGINDFRDYQEAIPVALSFFLSAGWGCLAAILLAFAVSYVEKRWRQAEKKRQEVEFALYKRTIEDLQRELDDVKRFVNYQG